MNREERRQRRKKDTQKALIAMIIFVVVMAGVIVAAVMAVNKYVIPNLKRPGKNVTTTEEPSEDGMQDGMDVSSEQVDPLLEQANQIVAGMTLEQKAAQIFMITPDALTGVQGATRAGESTKAAYAQYPVGGLIYMAANLTGSDQTKEMLSNMKNYSEEIAGLPIFLGVDEEGGSVTRIASNSAFGVTDVGNMSEVGATGDAQNAFNAGSTIGAYLSTLGFNVDFAPVADVLSNPDNTVMKDRSFGSDSQLVADMVCSEMQGLSEYQVLSVVKHFPGQGAVAGDSHDGAVSTDKTLDELMANELVPFQQAINNGASIIMVGHISTPSVTGDDTPASVSSVMITDVLRNQMGFHGVVITDAMNMSAITDKYSSADAAVVAINAGADMILMPEDFNAAYQGIIDAVNNGTITEERLNESVARIIKVKLSM